MDISTTFNKVWHNGLHYKLRITQLLPDTMTRILCNYLTGRTAVIKIGNYMGQTFKRDSGVPQGGCSSPTPFNIIMYS